MIKQILFLLLFSLSVAKLPAQKIDKKLQQQVEALIKGFNGSIGMYAKNLKNGKIVTINADTIFPTA
ncbi:MAG TPA: hypothetical protein VNA26_00515, partial [Chitinophagaceae bacterium]|nr:hypothetical protein [Chitinophagaceae bacterium]